MMSQIHCKQSIRIEKSGWFKHYFPGNLRRNILFKVCNYTSYQNLQKNSLPNPFAREKAGDKAGLFYSYYSYYSILFYKDSILFYNYFYIILIYYSILFYIIL